MKVLVTGATGLIGSHLAEILSKEGHEVYGTDNFSLSSKDTINKDLYQKFFEVDLLDEEGAEALMKAVQPEIVYHCAAWAHEGLAQFSPRLIIENNIDIFTNTIVSAIRNGMKRFVFVSSIAVYGDQPAPFKEDAIKQPAEIYGACKAFIENTIEVLAKVHEFDYTIFRCYNVFGEGQYMSDPYRNVVAILMNNILKEKPISIYGDGEQKRSFTYIGDIAQVMVKGGMIEEGKNQIFNMGDDRLYSINELVEAISDASGKEINPEHLPGRVQEVKVSYCDNTKAKEILGLDAITDFKTAIKSTWNYAVALGPQDILYLEEFELPSSKIPKNYYKQ